MSNLLNDLPRIIKSLQSSYGRDFFNSITVELNKIIGAAYTFIATIDAENQIATTVSLVAHGKLVDNINYELADTPCQIVTNDSVCVFSSGICNLFPKDQLLVDMGVEGYVGVGLYDSHQKLIGIVVALYEEEIKDTEQAKTLFELFSGRIAAEIERADQKNQLDELNLKLRAKLESLSESQSRLASHIENTPLGCITWDKDFRIAEWNKAAENIFGYSAEEAIGKHAEIILPDEVKPSVDIIFEQLINQEGGAHSTNENVNKSGVRVLCDWYNTPITNRNGEVIGVTSLVQDITEQQQQQLLLRRTKKMDALGKMTGGVAHDQNNILGIIIGYTELLTMQLENNPKLLGYAERIEHAAIRGKQLVSKLLSFSRTTPQEEVNTANLNNILLEQQDVLQKTITVQIKLHLALAEDIWSTRIDINDFNDALLNLTINAMHAIESQSSTGEIIVATANTSLTERQAKMIGATAGEYIKLSITDNGCGMDAHTLENVFDPFFSTKGEKGTGLGLAQVFAFSQRSNAVIDIISTPGRGTTISLYFPKEESEAECIDTPASQQQENNAPTRDAILVVDDEIHLLELAKELLVLEGYQVYIANGKAEALAVLADTPIDLVFSDVIMPDINGYELASIIKEKYPEIKIQLTSGYYDDHTIANIDEKLKRALLQKPYNKDSLYKTIRTCLDSEQVA